MRIGAQPGCCTTIKILPAGVLFDTFVYKHYKNCQSSDTFFEILTFSPKTRLVPEERYDQTIKILAKNVCF